MSKFFYFKCVYFGQPVSQNSIFRATYVRNCTVKTIVSYSASHYVGVNFEYE